MTIPEKTYIRYKVGVLRQIVELVETAKEKSGEYLPYESAYMSIKDTNRKLRMINCKEYLKKYKADYDEISGIFGVKPKETKEIHIRLTGEILADTNNMFMEAALKYFKDYIEANSKQ